MRRLSRLEAQRLVDSCRPDGDGALPRGYLRCFVLHSVYHSVLPSVVRGLTLFRGRTLFPRLTLFRGSTFPCDSWAHTLPFGTS